MAILIYKQGIFMKKVYVLELNKKSKGFNTPESYLEGVFSTLNGTFNALLSNEVVIDIRKAKNSLDDNNCAFSEKIESEYDTRYYSITMVELNTCNNLY